MEILVYAAERWQVSTFFMFRDIKKMFPGMEINRLTCPQLTHETFPYERLADAYLVYFRLHGKRNQPYLYGQGKGLSGWQTGFSIELFRESGVKMRPESKVFLEGCFNALTGVPQAFLEAGAGEVIAASTTTWNGTLRPGPAAKLGIGAIKAWLGPENRSAIADVRVANVALKRKYRMGFARYGGHRR